MTFTTAIAAWRATAELTNKIYDGIREWNRRRHAHQEALAQQNSDAKLQNDVQAGNVDPINEKFGFGKDGKKTTNENK